MTRAETAVRREITETKRHLARLERSLEILTGKRGIDGAPALDSGDDLKRATQGKLDVKQRGRKSSQRRGRKRKSGQLVKEIKELLADGRPRTAREVAKAVNGDFTAMYSPLRKSGAKVFDNLGQRGSVRWQIPVRELVISSERGAVEEGRIKGPVGI